MTQAGLAIGEFSRRTGRKVETIRYYERIGLLPVPDRRGRYRRYDTTDVRLSAARVNWALPSMKSAPCSPCQWLPAKLPAPACASSRRVISRK
jgi:hypothetical protein